jgi:acyl-CoA thioester hydrolase
MSMIEVLRSGVNTWECDQMGHLNVRHYFACANRGLAVLALQLGLPPSQLRAQGVALRAVDQHVRFLRELRPGASYAMHAGVLAVSPERLQVYAELRRADKITVAASVISEVALQEISTGRAVPWPASVLARAAEVETNLSAEHGPRGIARTAPRPAPTRADALALPLIGAYLAPVEREDCDAHGVMQESAFMARVSDGIGHFFHVLRGERGANLGGAALEYRYVFHERPRLGDVIEVRSGLKGLGNKTTQLCHWVFNLETGRCAATSEAVAVSFDLTTRKAIEISAEARAHMETRIVPGLSV